MFRTSTCPSWNLGNHSICSLLVCLVLLCLTTGDAVAQKKFAPPPGGLAGSGRANGQKGRPGSKGMQGQKGRMGQPGGNDNRRSAAQRKQDEKKYGKIPRGDGKSPYPAPKRVDAAKLASAKASAKKIDAMIRSAQLKHRVQPNPPLTDEQFVRRAYLDITGTIPSGEQAYKFLLDKSRVKREKLIDTLLNSEGYVSTSFNYWGNLLRVRDRLAQNNGNVIAQSYHEWLKKSLRENMHYDDWVREMLTAEGLIWDNGAVGYLMRDSGMELDAVDNMVRTFLGTQIGCARCHDHPFDNWTQMEFYRMAAYMFPARTRYSGGDKKRFGKKNPVTRIREEMKKIDPDQSTGGDFNRIVQANFYAVWDQPGRKLRLPHDYQYDDAKPKSLVTPEPIFGQTITLKKGESSRKAVADWLVSPENPRFAKSIANRLWKRAMGQGLVEPVDDLKDDSVASIPALMKFLTAEMVRLDFDTKEFMRIIYNTKAWQRQATTKEINPLDPYYFQGPTLRRMTAEQVWDSLLTMAVYHPESFRRTDFSEVKKTVEVDLKNVNASEILRRSKEFAAKYGSRAMRENDRDHAYKGMTLARASELPIPVPANHFLRQFGQGDRELIDTASTDGSVSQILTMFNGQITHMMLEAGSVIYDNLLRARSMKDQVDVIFLSILSRRPTASERKVAEEEIKRHKKKRGAGYGNVIWALINTKEFLFIQ